MMGYRSEVAYVIQFDDMETKQEWVAIAKLHPTYSQALKECKFVDDMDKDYISAYFGHVKWYDSFDDVKCHMFMLDAIAEDANEHVNARFIRIGEEQDDNEDMAYGDEGYNIPLYISRHVDTEFELGEVNG
jgi:hypothetical protein